MILGFVIIFTNNNVFAQNLHNRTLEEIAKQTSGFDKIAVIDVGNSPTDIDENDYIHTAYVANSGSNTVSVISIENNTKIKDILVGQAPRDMVSEYNYEIFFLDDKYVYLVY